MNTITKKTLVLALLFLVFGATLLAETAPCLIPFQGRLTNQGDETYTKGQYTLIFNLYDKAVGGTSVWTERHEKVGVVNGMVNVFLGSINPIESIDFSSTWYLGITVDADNNSNSYDPEMVPRQMILPSFFAKNAQKLQGYDWSAVLTGDQTVDMSKRYLKMSKIEDESLTSNKIKNGTILPEDFSDEVLMSMIPVGTILSYGGPINTLPAGWLPCDGRIVERSKYERLFAVIGTNWNAVVRGELKENLIPLQKESTISRHIIPEDGIWGCHVSVSGNIFGAEPGEGRYVDQMYWWNGPAGTTGTMAYDYQGEWSHTYSFSDVSSGVYRVCFTKMKGHTSTYSLIFKYDGADHTINIPVDGMLSENFWTESDDIIVTNVFSSITASYKSADGLQNIPSGGSCIPAIQVIQVTPDIDNDATDTQFRVPDLSNLSLEIKKNSPSSEFNFIIKY